MVPQLLKINGKSHPLDKPAQLALRASLRAKEQRLSLLIGCLSRFIRLHRHISFAVLCHLYPVGAAQIRIRQIINIILHGLLLQLLASGCQIHLIALRPGNVIGLIKVFVRLISNHHKGPVLSGPLPRKAGIIAAVLQGDAETAPQIVEENSIVHGGNHKFIPVQRSQISAAVDLGVLSALQLLINDRVLLLPHIGHLLAGDGVQVAFPAGNRDGHA